MYRLPLNLTAGQTYDFYGVAGYARILRAADLVKLEAPDTDISTELYAGLGGPVSRPVFQVDEQGQETDIAIGQRFSRHLRISSPTDQYVEVLISAFESTDQQTFGEVAIQPRETVDGIAAVTAADGGATIAGSVGRSELILFADNANAGAFWVGGTVGAGVPVNAGGSLTLPVRGSVDVIADDAADTLYCLGVN